MLDHILIPLDGSTLAEKALEYGREIVKPGGNITLVSVVNMPELLMYDYYYPAPTVMLQNYEAAVAEAVPRARDYLTKIASQLGHECDAHIGIEVLCGEPAEALVETAERLGAKAIVMSTHGRSGLGRWLFGSVTAKVLEAATCPVLVVPNRAQSTPAPGEAETAKA
jgi:nucleotide-binding universal stress UspA family protein